MHETETSIMKDSVTHTQYRRPYKHKLLAYFALHISYTTLTGFLSHELLHNQLVKIVVTKLSELLNALHNALM